MNNTVNKVSALTDSNRISPYLRKELRDLAEVIDTDGKQTKSVQANPIKAEGKPNNRLVQKDV